VGKVARRGYKSSEQIAPQPATCFGAYCLVVQPLFLTGFGTEGFWLLLWNHVYFASKNIPKSGKKVRKRKKKKKKGSWF